MYLHPCSTQIYENVSHSSLHENVSHSSLCRCICTLMHVCVTPLCVSHISYALLMYLMYPSYALLMYLMYPSYALLMYLYTSVRGPVALPICEHVHMALWYVCTCMHVCVHTYTHTHTHTHGRHNTLQCSTEA
jgi:hypothetical protein